MSKPNGKISFWFLGIFLSLMGFINLKVKFLGYSSGKIFPIFPQYLISIVIIILGVLFLFGALIKSSSKFLNWVNKNSISLILFYLIAILFCSLIASIIVLFI
jgi:hypothetical protein